jgi:hypothetical protein
VEKCSSARAVKLRLLPVVPRSLTFPTLQFGPASHLVIATTSVNCQQPTGLHGLDVPKWRTEERPKWTVKRHWLDATTSMICGPIEQFLFAVPRLPGACTPHQRCSAVISALLGIEAALHMAAPQSSRMEIFPPPDGSYSPRL